jgi:hypothetical protein
MNTTDSKANNNPKKPPTAPPIIAPRLLDFFVAALALEEPSFEEVVGITDGPVVGAAVALALEEPSSKVALGPEVEPGAEAVVAVGSDGMGSIRIGLSLLS